MERENTIGAVHWKGLHIGFNGEQFVVVIPAFFQSQHVPYLQPIISARVHDLDDKISVSLKPGELSQTHRSTHYEPGSILLVGVSKPWPDAVVLRKSLESAFAEAGKIEEEQRAQARELERHLRAGDPPD